MVGSARRVSRFIPHTGSGVGVPCFGLWGLIARRSSAFHSLDIATLRSCFKYLGKVDDCRAAFTQVAFDTVAVGEGGFETVDLIGHMPRKDVAETGSRRIGDLDATKR